MKILVTGGNGMLANAFHKILEKRSDIQSIFVSKEELDITDFDAVKNYLEKNKYDAVINCAAYTKVDQAETEPEIANKINGEAVKNLAMLCKKLEVVFVTFSTDYVFDGNNPDGYKETEITNPLNAYGISKGIGEEGIKEIEGKYYLIRTQWLYGHGGKNFVDTIINVFKEGKDLKIVNDQFGSPTYTIDLAQQTLKILDDRKDYGIYHVTNSGSCSWYDFAKFFLERYSESEVKITPVTSEEFPRPAKRPHYSMLQNSKLTPSRSWEDAVTEYLKDYVKV